MLLNDYNATYAHKMRNTTYLNAYLEACLTEGPEAFYVGLRRAVQAREGGFTWLSKQTGLGRESLYRALRADGNPSFRTVFKVLTALGVDWNIVTHPQTGSVAARAGTNQKTYTASERKQKRGRIAENNQSIAENVLAVV